MSFFLSLSLNQREIIKQIYKKCKLKFTTITQMSILNKCVCLFFVVPTKEEEEVVEEMETSTSLEEDNIPVISR